jgi:nucleoid-associated protein YgaU
MIPRPRRRLDEGIHIKGNGVEHHRKGRAMGMVMTLVTIGFLIVTLSGLSEANPLKQSNQTYVVKKGDTLYHIARDHLGSAMKYKELAEINNLKIKRVNGVDHVLLKVGQVIKLSLVKADALPRPPKLTVRPSASDKMGQEFHPVVTPHPGFTRLAVASKPNLSIPVPVGIPSRLMDSSLFNQSDQTYVVKKGDTLTQIARDYLGSAKKYKKLAELNGLEIKKVKGVDHVRLRVGQVIKLSLTRDEALQRSWELIVKRIDRVRRIDLRDAPDDPLGLHINGMPRGKALTSRQNIHVTLVNLSHFKRVLEWYALWDFALAMRNVASERAKTPAQVIEYTKILLALAEQESSFRNRPGRHGEYSWWQMKPSTAVLLDRSVDLGTAEWLLQSDPHWTANRVLDHLLWGKKKYRSWEGAFTFYNGGPVNRHLKGSYAKQVMNRLKGI